MTDVDWWYLMMVNDITSGQAILTEDNDETHGWKGQFLHVTTALTLTGAPWMWHHPRLLPRAKAAGCGGKITGSSHYIQRLAIIGEKKHGFSEVLAGFRGLITKFREEFEFGFPSARLPGTSLFGINSCHRQVGEIHDQLRHELKEAVSNVAWQPAVQL